jgi:hypothetical protein
MRPSHTHLESCAAQSLTARGLRIPALLPLALSLIWCLPATAQDLKVSLWRNPTWPNGLDIERSGGISFGDLDADGWVDFFGARSGELWHNLGGQDWEVWRNLLPLLGRYGCAIGDFNMDGYPDIATETRGTVPEKVQVLRNTGTLPFFINVMRPGVVDEVPWGNCETNLWADVDFDGDPDLFVPVYPPWVGMTGSPGNFFLQNMGPTGPAGEHRFLELSREVGLDNIPGTDRPEGAEFCDVDGDGDLDLYCNGTLYQNRSSFGAPMFMPLGTPASGIPGRSTTDEGLFFFDYDLDGDFDLLISWCADLMIRIIESNGDGTFFLTNSNVIEKNGGKFCLGVSHADWDNDGDIDISTQEVFRRNMFVETGQRRFVVATHPIPPGNLQNTVNSWADWDKDGDLDLCIGAFGSVRGFFYDNTLYDANTPADQRRFVRIRVVMDAPGVPFGLANEYGASVEIAVEGDVTGHRRRQLVTSSGGYINQNEYTLHFALPPDPVPTDPDQDIYFSVAVDLPSDPSVGLRRIDRHVNPRLARIPLAHLDDREITVYRSGMVVVDGCEFPPHAAAQAVLVTSTNGLIQTTNSAPLVPPVGAPGSDWYVGLAFDTAPGPSHVRVQEVILDGRIGPGARACGAGKAEIVFWDVSDPASPFVVPGGTFDVDRRIRNDRNAYPVSVLLPAARRYRVVARVDELRPTPVKAPLVNGPITVRGGLSFSDPNPCSGLAVANAPRDRKNVYLSLRLAYDPGPLWVDLGYALAGKGGPSSLQGSGAIAPGSQLTLSLTGAPANQSTSLIVGLRAECRSMAGGLQIPSLDAVTTIQTDASGAWQTTITVPATALPGASLYAQVWYPEDGTPAGRAASNALSATVPY